MRRKMLLPALAACALLAVGAPVASASKAHASKSSATTFLLSAVKNINKKVGALQDLSKGFQAAFGSIHSALDPIVAAAPQILSGLTALKDGLTQAADGLTKLSDAVQGPNIAGQLGAAGTDPPGTSNTATPSTLPTGTVYRQIVIATGGALAGAPIGARTYVKLPDVAAVGYSNTYVCTGAGTSGAASNVGGSGHGYDLTCSGGAAAFGH